MRIGRCWGLVVPVLTLALAGGCSNCHHHHHRISSSYTPPCDRCGAAPLEARLSPQPPPAVPQPLPSGPPASILPPGPAAPPPGSAQDAPNTPWKPVTPDPVPEPRPGPGARLNPPEGARPLPTTPPMNVPRPEDPKEPPKDPDNGPSAFPVDIPQFVSVKAQIATGQKPRPDGLGWLKERGYRTVLYLKAPGEDDAATRRLVEGKKLRYEALEVSPETIKQGLVENFNRLLANSEALPIFVYDRDGGLAGAVWFLHLQTADKLSREKALDELTRLGYKPDEDGPQKDLWLAVQAYLSMNKAMSWQR